MSHIEVGTTDHLDPEVQAMLLAMYSRSYAPIASRIPDSEESTQQHKEKLGKFYLSWGHKSVGQLGSTTVWLEGVSQLAAKAIENHPLFNGQESSTRYIDYSNQPMVSFNEEVSIWQEKWRALYIKALPLVIEKIKGEFPFDVQYPCEAIDEEDNNKNKTTWNNTIKARAFDICRGLLPAGCTTNAGFVGTFDTLNDHFGEMLFHPSMEMKSIAMTVLEKMKEKYPYGTMDIDKLAERNSYITDDFFYQKPSKLNTDGLFFLDKENSFIDEEIVEFLSKREKYQKINRVASSRIRMIYRNLLDFGSYRDIHRHRNGVVDMCVLTPNYGFHSFYFENLPESIQPELDVLVNEYHKWYNESSEHISEVNKQYSTPMGYTIPVSYSCDLNQALYMFELRTGKTVHQTLRMFMQDWATRFSDAVGNKVRFHADFDEDNFSLKRGTQTFAELPSEQKEKKVNSDISKEDLDLFKFCFTNVLLDCQTKPDNEIEASFLVGANTNVNETVSLLTKLDIGTLSKETVVKGFKVDEVITVNESAKKLLDIYAMVFGKNKTIGV